MDDVGAWRRWPGLVSWDTLARCRSSTTPLVVTASRVHVTAFGTGGLTKQGWDAAATSRCGWTTQRWPAGMRRAAARRVGQPRHAELATKAVLSLRLVLYLALRETAGLTASVLRVLGLTCQSRTIRP